MLGVNVTVTDLGAFLLRPPHNQILTTELSLTSPIEHDPYHFHLPSVLTTCFHSIHLRVSVSKIAFSMCLADIAVLRIPVHLQFFVMFPQHGKLQSYLYVLNRNIFPSTLSPKYFNFPSSITVHNHGSQSYKTTDKI
jgi:hypothetical protein